MAIMEGIVLVIAQNLIQLDVYINKRSLNKNMVKELHVHRNY